MARQKATVGERVLLTASEAADLLGVSDLVFRKDIAPQLMGVMVRSTWRYPRTEIDKWVERRKEPTGGVVEQRAA
jgi:excisionase family DNA binding protein